MTDRKEKKASEFRRATTRNLATTRMMQQMSQSQLAEKIGTTKSSISRIESGGQNITLDYVAAIAEAIGKEPVITLRDPVMEYGDESEYSLKLYDEELMRFRLSRDYKVPYYEDVLDRVRNANKVRFTAEITYVNEARKNLLPIDMELTDSGVGAWLTSRTIPKNRAFVGNILSALGLNITDIKGIIDVCLGLSLNDSYWVTQTDFDGSFTDYNLYENEFSEALSLIAYVGGMYNTEKFRTSPELTTGGMLRKAWRRMEDNGIWLYKGGTEGFANTGNEPYCEYYAYQVAKKMGLNATPYSLERWKNTLASKCRLFTDIDTAYVPIGGIVKSGGIEAVLEYYKQLGDEYYQQVVSMLVFDAVIVNEDRHYGNFGILRDNHSGEVVAPAPIFDNGLSLLCYAMRQDFDDLEEYIKTRSNPYGAGYQFMDLAKSLMGPVQRKQLRRLIGFRFEESDISNLPTWRLRALEEMIQNRVQELLNA